jgi:hypothetical protein
MESENERCELDIHHFKSLRHSRDRALSRTAGSNPPLPFSCPLLLFRQFQCLDFSYLARRKRFAKLF